MKRLLSAIRNGACVLAFGAGPAHAVPITFDFTGTLSSVSGAAPFVFAPGATFSGSFTYESETPASPVCISAGCYDDALLALVFSIGDYAASYVPPPAPSGSVLVANDSFGADSFHLDGRSFIETGAVRFGAAPTALLINLVDRTASAFSAYAPLPTTLDLADFDFRELLMGFRTGGEFTLVLGQIDSLAPAATVPEPGSAALLGLAFALAVTARRRWTRR